MNPNPVRGATQSLFHSLSQTPGPKRTPRIHQVSEKVTLTIPSAGAPRRPAIIPPESLCSVERRTLSVHRLLSAEARWATRERKKLQEFAESPFRSVTSTSHGGREIP